MISLPPLSGWTLATVEQLASEGVYESDTFDLKEMLPHSKNDEDKVRMRKSIAAFANSAAGGFLIFGVKDDKNLLPVDRIVGLPTSEDFPEKFGNYSASILSAVGWSFKNPAIPTSKPDRVVHVVYVPSSIAKPHAVEVRDGELCFPKRTNKGNETMAYDEVRSAFQYAEFRRAGLKILIAELEHIQGLAQQVLADFLLLKSQQQQDPASMPFSMWTTRYPTTLLDSVLADAHSSIEDNPQLWSLLREVRTGVVRHNAMCEGVANIVYLALSGRAAIVRDHIDIVVQIASAIAPRIAKATSLLRGILRTESK